MDRNREVIVVFVMLGLWVLAGVLTVVALNVAKMIYRRRGA